MSVDLSSDTPVTSPVDQFGQTGHVVIRGVFSRDMVERYRWAFRDYVAAGRESMSPGERAMGASATRSVFKLAEAPAVVAELVTSPVLGQIAAELMGIEAVRLLHFTGFFKSGGGPGTPWHQDLTFIPLDTSHAVSIWMPLTPVTREMGALVFAEGSHLQGPLNPNTDRTRFVIRENPAMETGDISVHSGWTLHSSLENSSPHLREAVAMCYYPDGSRIQRRHGFPFPQSLMESHFPGLAEGDLAVGPSTPVVYRRKESRL